MMGAGPHNIWAETKRAPFVSMEEQKTKEVDLITIFKHLMEDYRKRNEARLFAGIQ